MTYDKPQAKAASRAYFRGIWAAITTPFTPALELDEAGLRQNMRYLTGTMHVDGVFCTGVMGEYWALTKEERKRIVEIVVEEARGKCGVIAQTGRSVGGGHTRHPERVGEHRHRVALQFLSTPTEQEGDAGDQRRRVCRASRD